MKSFWFHSSSFYVTESLRKYPIHVTSAQATTQNKVYITWGSKQKIFFDKQFTTVTTHKKGSKVSTWHIATLQLKHRFTLMTNLGQVCLFSNLITTWNYCTYWCCEFWLGAVGTSLFFTGFKVVICWWMNKILKWVGISKRGGIMYQGGSLFLSIKTYVTSCSCYSYFSKKEMPTINLMTALLF